MILSILVGLISGIIGGFSGIAGSILVLTALNFFRMVPDQQTASGTTLFIFISPLSIIALYHYWKKGKIDFRIAWLIMGFYAVGAGLGALGSNKFSDKQLKLFLSILFFVLGITSFVVYRRDK